jgi:acetyl-CoA carboxylase biotin carboxyl carrier protein
MTVEEIRELIDLVVQSGIAELEVQRGDNKVRVRRTAGILAAQDILLPGGSGAQPAPMLPQASAPPVPQGGHAVAVSASPAPVAAGPVGAAAPPAAATPEVDPDAILVKSPIVGTYYESPSPNSPPFIKVGDKVQPGQVLCIIESMKLMNEIEAEVAGTLVAKLVANGRPVEYGESLFAIKP